MNDSSIIRDPDIARIYVELNDFIKSLSQEDQVSNLTEFDSRLDFVQELINKTQKAYSDTQDKYYIKKLNQYLEDEIHTLDMIYKTLLILNSGHEVIGLVDGQKVKMEWEDVRILSMYQNIKHQINIIKRLEKLQKDVDYSDQLKQLENKKDHLNKKCIAAYNRIIDLSIKNKVEREEPIDKELLLNEEYFEELSSLDEKIDYLEYVLKALEKTKGSEKTGFLRDGIKVKVANSYVPKYEEYLARYNNLKEKLESAINSEIDSLDWTENIENQLVEQAERIKEEELLVKASEFAELYIQYDKLKQEILSLGQESNEYRNAQTIEVPFREAENQKLIILEERKDYFKQLYAKYFQIVDKLSIYEKEYGFEWDPDMDQKTTEIQNLVEKNLSKKKQKEKIQIEKYKRKKSEKELYHRIQFLKRQRSAVPEVQQEINSLRKELYSLNKKNKFRNLVNLKIFFATVDMPGTTESLKSSLNETYTAVVQNIQSFLRYKEYTDEQKEKTFLKIIEKLKKGIKDNRGYALFEMDGLAFENKMEEKDKYIKGLEEQIEKLKSLSLSIPPKDSKTLEIVETYTPKSKRKLTEKIQKKHFSILHWLGKKSIQGQETFIDSDTNIKSFSEEKEKIKSKKFTHVDMKKIMEECNRSASENILENQNQYQNKQDDKKDSDREINIDWMKEARRQIRFKPDELTEYDKELDEKALDHNNFDIKKMIVEEPKDTEDIQNIIHHMHYAAQEKLFENQVAVGYEKGNLDKRNTESTVNQLAEDLFYRFQETADIKLLKVNFKDILTPKYESIHIYADYKDAYKKSLNCGFVAVTEFPVELEVTGIIYDFQGDPLFISQSDENAVEKIKNMEANHISPIGVRVYSIEREESYFLHLDELRLFVPERSKNEVEREMPNETGRTI